MRGEHFRGIRSVRQIIGFTNGRWLIPAQVYPSLHFPDSTILSHPFLGFFVTSSSLEPSLYFLGSLLLFHCSPVPSPPINHLQYRHRKSHPVYPLDQSKFSPGQQIRSPGTLKTSWSRIMSSGALFVNLASTKDPKLDFVNEGFSEAREPTWVSEATSKELPPMSRRRINVRQSNHGWISYS